VPLRTGKRSSNNQGAGAHAPAGAVGMRLMLVCAALCVGWPVQTSRDYLQSQGSHPHTATALIEPAGSARSDDFALRFMFEVHAIGLVGVLERALTPDTVPPSAALARFAPTAAAPMAAASDVFEPEPGRVFSRAELCSAAASVAAANNLPVPFFANLIQQESGFKPRAVSPAGAQGIAQFMPRVAAEQGLHDPFDPIPALQTSGKVLSQLRARFGNLGLAAAAYNAGPRRVQDWMTRRGKLPAETRQYVRNITGRPAEHWVRRAVNVLEHRLPLFARCAEAKTALANASARETAAARPKTTLAVRAAASVKKRVVQPSVEIRRAEAPKRERVASR
jgi:hypothetical protein